jgi:hypothetical protein
VSVSLFFQSVLSPNSAGILARIQTNFPFYGFPSLFGVCLCFIYSGSREAAGSEIKEICDEGETVGSGETFRTRLYSFLETADGNLTLGLWNHKSAFTRPRLEY